ncbi:hypothetical protein VIGAN_11063100 [Vigna angularis var. angularis]|uniref:Uncharacterized protein n=1 Tax=Vigna angularis var. angularis TaxID=157739 RepID=A0A0S3T817_PHAAN|nr:hypothetical protein VIGAN_11063100 [Vigna angularis var. angularis]
MQQITDQETAVPAQSTLQNKFNLAFLEAWGIACSLAGFINLVFPSGETFLIYPVDIGGPCRSKIILTVSSQSQISHMLTNSAGKLTVLLGVSCILLLVSQSVMISLDKISS